MVSNHESTSGSAIKPTKHNALWLCTTYGRLHQPKHDAPAVWMHLSTSLSFELSWGLNLMGKWKKACPQHHKNNETWDHQNCYFNWTKVRVGGWNNRSFWILIGLDDRRPTECALLHVVASVWRACFSNLCRNLTGITLVIIGNNQSQWTHTQTNCCYSCLEIRGKLGIFTSYTHFSWKLQQQLYT